MKELFPVIKHNRQIYSCDLDPPFDNCDYITPVIVRRGNRKNECSEAMSRALGFNRYEGAGSAIRQAREISGNYRSGDKSPVRGPCPQFLRYAPSNPRL